MGNRLGVRVDREARRLKRLTVAFFVLFALSIALPIAWLSATHGRGWAPRVGVPDALKEIDVDLEHGCSLRVAVVMREGGASVAVEDASLVVRIFPWDGARVLDEAAHVETRIGVAHFCERSGETVLETEIPCNLRGRMVPGVNWLEARVTVLVADRPPLEGMTRFLVEGAAVAKVGPDGKR